MVPLSPITGLSLITSALRHLLVKHMVMVLFCQQPQGSFRPQNLVLEDSFYLLKIGRELSPPTGLSSNTESIKKKQCDGVEDAKRRIIIDYRTQRLTTTPTLKLEDGVVMPPKRCFFSHRTKMSKETLKRDTHKSEPGFFLKCKLYITDTQPGVNIKLKLENNVCMREYDF